MAKRDPRVDKYIEEAAPFARPILKHLRKVVHAGCPDTEETIKWRFPHFDYKGMMCSMAAFKAHCAFGFWKARLLFGEDALTEREAMGHFGRITKLSDLPDEKKLISYVRKAAALNDEGVPLAQHKRARETGPLPVPEDLEAALKKNAKARKTFEEFNPSSRKDYITWLTEAKRESTRKERLATTIEWLSQGKRRNWKYETR